MRCSQSAGERTVITTDIAVENVHFKTEYMTFREIGFKISAANVSDCSAMASRPEAALVNLVFPPLENSLLRKHAIELYKGFVEACEKWNFRVIGGDLASGPSWMIGITMIGSVPQNGRLLTRKGICSGDRLWATGLPGQSAAGLSALAKWGRKDVPPEYQRLVMCHVRPEPDVEMGFRLGECSAVHAMMDLSDGISKDGRTLCFENNLGLALNANALFPPGDMVALARILNEPVLNWLLHGGEEYVLLFACAPDFDPVQMFPDSPITDLGTFTALHNKIIARVAGDSLVEVSRGSWDHLGKDK
jgi:thiamine-monophosphate kinase